MRGWTLDYYETTAGRCPVAEYLNGLDGRDADVVTRRLDLLEEYGTALGAPYVKHLRGKLWELRAKGRVQHRVLYFVVSGQTIVLLHAFVKKTQATPEQEITTALSRLSDYEARRTP
jgi:phage-related protein